MHAKVRTLSSMETSYFVQSKSCHFYTLQVTLKHLWGGFSVSEAIREKRLHHQWIPNLIQYETGYNEV